jgi:hypothetical protein
MTGIAIGTFIEAPIMAVIGYGLQRLIFNRPLGGDILPYRCLIVSTTKRSVAILY